MKNKELYNQVKLAGLLLFIPLVLVSGPVAGVVIGDILEKKFGWKIAVPLCLGMFTIASLIETAQILRRVLRLEKNK